MKAMDNDVYGWFSNLPMLAGIRLHSLTLFDII
jgi:hypothetical protein